MQAARHLAAMVKVGHVANVTAAIDRRHWVQRKCSIEDTDDGAVSPTSFASSAQPPHSANDQSPGAGHQFGSHQNLCTNEGAPEVTG